MEGLSVHFPQNEQNTNNEILIFSLF